MSSIPLFLLQLSPVLAWGYFVVFALGLFLPAIYLAVRRDKEMSLGRLISDARRGDRFAIVVFAVYLLWIVLTVPVLLILFLT